MGTAPFGRPGSQRQQSDAHGAECARLVLGFPSTHSHLAGGHKLLMDVDAGTVRKDDLDPAVSIMHDATADMQDIANHPLQPGATQFGLVGLQPRSALTITLCASTPSNISICWAAKRFLLRLVIPKLCLSSLIAISTHHRADHRSVRKPAAPSNARAPAPAAAHQTLTAGI